MIKTINSKLVYKNRWMEVKEDKVEFSNGQKGVYGVVKKDDFALIIPFDGTHFYMVKQYRYPIKKDSLEFPQGKHEDDPDITPEILAKAELEEETGLTSSDIKSIGHLCVAPGYSNQGFHIFLAKRLTQGKQHLEETEHGLEVERITLKEFEELTKKGVIVDSPTLAAYSLLKVQDLI